MFTELTEVESLAATGGFLWPVFDPPDCWLCPPPPEARPPYES